MIDIATNDGVDIQISANGKNLWVNVGGECVLRIQQIKALELDDQRRTRGRRKKPADDPSSEHDDWCPLHQKNPAEAGCNPAPAG